MSPPRPMPLWTPAVAADGRLDVHWPSLEPEPHRLVVVVALRRIDEADVAGFWAGDFDADLVRQPAERGATAATLYVPAGRPLWLGLVATDAAGAPAPAVASGALDARSGVGAGARALEGPVPHSHPPDAGTELVFVAGPGESAPDLAALAGRVARQVVGGADAAGSMAPPARGAFGAKQRWYLTRLGWPEGADSGPRALIRRPTFITAEEVARWSHELPPDAEPLPPDADGLVDGATPDDATAFYVVMQGPAPWRPLPLAPIPPPFDASRRPVLVGDVESPLTAAVTVALDGLEAETLALADLDPRLSLLEAAAQVLPADAQARRAVAGARQRWARGGRLP